MGGVRIRKTLNHEYKARVIKIFSIRTTAIILFTNKIYKRIYYFDSYTQQN